QLLKQRLEIEEPKILDYIKTKGNSDQETKDLASDLQRIVGQKKETQEQIFQNVLKLSELQMQDLIESNPGDKIKAVIGILNIFDNYLKCSQISHAKASPVDLILNNIDKDDQVEQDLLRRMTDDEYKRSCAICNVIAWIIEEGIIPVKKALDDDLFITMIKLCFTNPQSPIIDVSHLRVIRALTMKATFEDTCQLVNMQGKETSDGIFELSLKFLKPLIRNQDGSSAKRTNTTGRGRKRKAVGPGSQSAKGDKFNKDILEMILIYLYNILIIGSNYTQTQFQHSNGYSIKQTESENQLNSTNPFYDRMTACNMFVALNKIIIEESNKDAKEKVAQDSARVQFLMTFLLFSKFLQMPLKLNLMQKKCQSKFINSKFQSGVLVC
ncbi:MAG: hypothetical protein EZS28_036458, partial [Streblomastix strix]